MVDPLARDEVYTVRFIILSGIGDESITWSGAIYGSSGIIVTSDVL